MVAVTPYSPQGFFLFRVFQEFLTLARSKQFSKLRIFRLLPFKKTMKHYPLVIQRTSHKSSQTSKCVINGGEDLVCSCLCDDWSLEVDVWHTFLSLFKLLCPQGEVGGVPPNYRLMGKCQWMEVARLNLLQWVCIFNRVTSKQGFKNGKISG